MLDRGVKNIGSRFEKQPLVEASIRLMLAEPYQALGEYGEARRQAERSVQLRTRKHWGRSTRKLLPAKVQFARALSGQRQDLAVAAAEWRGTP